MKKLLAIILCLGLVLGFAACGGDEGSNAEPAGIEGKYISVAGEAFGLTMTGEEIAGFDLELKVGGKGAMSVEGESLDIKWSLDGETISISGGGQDFVGTVGEDIIVFDDFLGMGMKLTFAIEGSAAADPSLYMPEADKALVGTWTSYSVTDVLGDDASAETDAAGLQITFNADHSAQGTLGGADLGLDGYEWAMSETMGFFMDSADCVISSWEFLDDNTLEITYSDDEDYYIYLCARG